MKKAITVCYLLLICLLGSACATTSLIVNSSGDEHDINTTDGKCETINNECTLRAAIMEANVSVTGSLITFENIGQINPTSDLPAITASNTHINGEGVVIIDGTLCGDDCSNGIRIANSSYNIIQGLIIRYFSRGIYIQGVISAARNNRIGLLPGATGDGSEGNNLNNNSTGVSIYGQSAFKNSVAGNHFTLNSWHGVSIANGAHDNLIGTLTGTGVEQGWNWFYNNGGLSVNLSGVHDNHITGNLIGTSLDGNSPLGNSSGIKISNSSNNIIGIAPSGEGNLNLISGNTYDGIKIEGSSDHGTNGDGTADAIEGNLISGNNDHGIKINNTNSIKNVIAGNYIGTNFDATAPIGNGGAGIMVGGDLNLIGTNGDGVSDSLEANVISGNNNVGIFLASFNCIVSGNYIGVDKTGMTAIGNLLDGITINPLSSNNRIGTNGDGVADAAERNIISGNGLAISGNAGIGIDGDNNVVAGNFIGTDATGNTGLGNMQDGIQLSISATGNLIGTDGDGTADYLEGNLISGNGRIGVWLLGTHLNTVAGNLIGTNISGTSAIPNMHAVNSLYGAVFLTAGASGNIIGTNSDGSNDSAEGNLISGNAQRGIGIKGASTHFNIVAGNIIGTDISGSSALGNAVGIEISEDAYLNQIGTDEDGNSDIAERNLVSGNYSDGIYVRGSQNLIAGNFIGTDISGTADLGNGKHGISIADTSTQNTIGGSIQKANLIAFNTRAGVIVKGMDADTTLISHNSIHSNGEQGINLTAGDSAMFTPNDSGDIDPGPNDLMNFPILNSASSTPGLLTITGEIMDGLPYTNFVIHFYANDVCDSPSAHGEGKTYLGSTTQNTDGGGNVSFLANLTPGVPAGQFITSTATTGDKTSEFSGCVEVVDVQNYSLELDEERCGQFEEEEMTLTTFEVDPDLLVLNMYVKKPSGFPGGEAETNGDAEEWVYTAFLGEVEARLCNFQGFEDRLYCNFLIPVSLLNTSQAVKFYLNDCGPPIYVNENVTIFKKEIKEPATECSSDFDERANELVLQLVGLIRAVLLAPAPVPKANIERYIGYCVYSRRNIR